MKVQPSKFNEVPLESLKPRGQPQPPRPSRVDTATGAHGRGCTRPGTHSVWKRPLSTVDKHTARSSGTHRACICKPHDVHRRRRAHKEGGRPVGIHCCDAVHGPGSRARVRALHSCEPGAEGSVGHDDVDAELIACRSSVHVHKVDVCRNVARPSRLACAHAHLNIARCRGAARTARGCHAARAAHTTAAHVRAAGSVAGARLARR